jgi:hypothetical protein
MGERRPSEAELDALIEAALAGEKLLPVPVGLHARVTERVQLAALQQRERVRFRNALVSGFVAALGIVLAVAALVATTKFDVLLKHGISGGRGLLDSYTATFALSWPQYWEGLVLSLFLAIGVTTVWVGLLPWRGRGGNTQAGRGGNPTAQGPLQMR